MEIYAHNSIEIPPVRTAKGERVIVYRMKDWDPEEFACSLIICAGFFVSQMVAWEEKTQIGGFVIVCDTSGFNLKQFKSMSWTDLKYVCMLIQVKIIQLFTIANAYVCRCLNYVSSRTTFH